MAMRTEAPITEQPHGLAGWTTAPWAERGAALPARIVRHSFLASLAFTATVIVLVIVLPAYV